MIGNIFISMRPRQWLKNGFVLAALVFSRSYREPGKLLAALAVGAAFCLLSSAVYLLNDLADREQDRRHLRKRLRPIASGRLSPAVALPAAGLLAAAGLGGAFAVGTGPGLVGAGYFFLMLAYSLLLKQIVIVDVLVISAGFILRILAGGLAISVPISIWLYLCTFLLTLFLALGKRRHEPVLPGPGTGVAGGYTAALLDQMIAVVTSSTLMAYALYTMDSRTRAEVSPLMFLTIPPVVYGIFRYLYLVYVRGQGDEPERLLVSDPLLMGNLVLWAAAVLAVLAWAPGR